MTDSNLDDRPYRPCVGIMMLNRDGDVFVGNRLDVPGDHWQMPQGGIDDGEEPVEAALREAEEETGVSADSLSIIQVSETWRPYDLPTALSRRIWKGKYKGQTQIWVLIRFLGEDHQIDLTRHNPEFGAWKWVNPDEVTDLIVPFKRDIYEQVLEEFRPLATPLT